ncbi:MAG TPA: hypothetical protein VEU07_06175 [Candidatus Acidoferrum sp.]|nr:hypothetical protein [Candidatus Acidoferrum sp.]
MEKKPVKSSGNRAKKSAKVRDLPAKSLKADKAAAVKGGIIVGSMTAAGFSNPLNSTKIDATAIKIDTTTCATASSRG